MSQSQSGRAAAQARRQAQLGGASTSPTKTSASQRKAAPEHAPIPTRAQQRAAQAAPAAPVVPATPVSAPKERAQVGSPVVVAEGREAAQKRRQAQLRGNRGYQKQTSENPHPKAKAYMNRVAAQEAVKQEDTPAPKVEAAPKSFDVSRGNDRRNTVKKMESATASNPGRDMSRAYRKARTLGKTGETAYKSKGSQSGAVARMNNPEASSRDIARSVRAERCARGKTCSTGATSNANRGRKGRERSAPEKVGHSTTLAGQGVSGTQVGQGSATGAEYGACQVVSGTEYLSSEEFNTHCESAPEAGKPKVTRTQTTKGESVSGTVVGNAEAVTGDRAGSCRGITGTEYLPADQSELFCGANANQPAKVSGGFSVNATQMNMNQGASNVTGADGYKSTSVTIRPTAVEMPEKVVTSQTVAGNQTTGTQVGRIEDVTGDERGYCQQVSGTGYQGVEEAETFCNTQPEPSPAKITISSTTRGQSISGDRSGSIAGMTGAEAGSCKAVTGTPYMSFEHSSSCGTEARAEIQHRMMGSVMPGKHSMTGAKPGPEGLTGAQKGACELVTGTPYQGAGQTAAVCGGQATASQPGESDFPQLMNNHVPAAPVNAPQMMMQSPVNSMPQTAPAEEAPVQHGPRITGDGWDRSSKVTGTEGEWATRRNPSFRGGQQPTQIMGAHNYRPESMPEVPVSTITGSSGNTETGAKVTLSGGARA